MRRGVRRSLWGSVAGCSSSRWTGSRGGSSWRRSWLRAWRMSLRGSRNGAGLVCLLRLFCCLWPREVPTNGTERLAGVIGTGGEAMTRREQVDAVPRLTDDEWREVRLAVARIAERLD